MVNKVILLGHAGADPEIRALENGKVGRIRLATTETYKDKNGNKIEQVEWHNVSLFGALADNADKYVKKGQQLYIEGRIHYRDYTDKNGEKRYVTDIIASVMRITSAKSAQTEQAQQPAPAPVQTPEPPARDIDDLPF